MSLRDLPLVAVFIAVCAALYLLTALIPSRNRTRRGYLTVSIAWLTASVLTYVFWALFLLPDAPFGRNWGLGGACLFLSIYPFTLLLASIVVLLLNRPQKGVIS